MIAALRGLSRLKVLLLSLLRLARLLNAQRLLSGLADCINLKTSWGCVVAKKKKVKLSSGSNDEPVLYTGLLSELAHCKQCSEPLFIIYDQSLREYCAECEAEILGS